MYLVNVWQAFQGYEVVDKRQCAILLAFEQEIKLCKVNRSVELEDLVDAFISHPINVFIGAGSDDALRHTPGTDGA